MQFEKISQFLFSKLKKTEDLNINLEAEKSCFVRFNNSKIRQSTHVDQNVLQLTLRENFKEAKCQINVQLDLKKDELLLKNTLNRLRSELKVLPSNESFTPFTNNGSSHKVHASKLPADLDMLKDILAITNGVDFTGLLCKGPIIRANSNSKGQMHWFETDQFFIDYSLFDGPRAVKGCVANSIWDKKQFADAIQESKTFLKLMNKPIQSLKRGKYKTYLAPSAVAEIMSMMSWGALSYEQYKKGSSAFKKLYDREYILSSKFSMRENFGLGMTPTFNDLGEPSPETLNIIHNGHLKNFLVSTKSAHEYKIPSNYAASSEAPRSLEILPGDLKKENIFKELGTGVYLSNLHYINWSDQNHARVTGMTRYACFYVQDGEIVGPIQDMRFDESLFDLFGKNLIDLTNFQTFDTNIGTYYNRNVGGQLLPGILAHDFTFTL